MFGLLDLCLRCRLWVLLGFTVGLLFASWAVWFGSFVVVRFATLICVGYDFFWFLLLYIVIDCYYVVVVDYAVLGGLGVVIDVCIWVFFVSGCYVVLGFVLFGWVWIFEVLALWGWVWFDCLWWLCMVGLAAFCWKCGGCFTLELLFGVYVGV